MKTKNILLILGVLMMAFSSCKKDNPNDPILPIQLSTEKVELKIGESQSLTIKGGDGKYTISPATYVHYELRGTSLVLTGKAVGTEEITITSAGKTAKLVVVVSDIPAPVPDLGTKYGIYKDGQLLFSYAMKAATKNGVWLCEKSEAPYQRRLFLSYLKGSPTIGETISLKIIAEGSIPSLPNTGNQGKNYTLVIKKMENSLVYLLDENSKLWFVIRRK